MNNWVARTAVSLAGAESVAVVVMLTLAETGTVVSRGDLRNRA
jgi:hypothetical protein